MSELKERFQSLDRVPAPDLWRDISRREPADVSLGPQWRRVAVAALAFVIAAAGMGVATWAFVVSRDNRRVVRPPIAAKRNGLIAFDGVKGSGVRFPLAPGERPRIYVMNPDGKRIRPITGTNAKEPAWSPDGSRLAFVVGGEFGGYELDTARADGSGLVHVMTTHQYISVPTWSPDGQEIAVAMGGSNTDYDLYVMSVDGSGLRQITKSSGDESAPDWSPDGSEIVYVASDDSSSGRPDVSVVGADGTNVRRLTRTPQFEFSPKWSADGKHIAFVRTGGQDHPASIEVMNADGTEDQALFACTDCLSDVEWSPDGTKLLFSQFQRSSWHLWVMNADGTHLSQVDTGPYQACCVSWQPVPVSIRSPASPTPIPSGSLSPTPPAGFLGDIAYQTSFGSDGQIWVMHPDGSGARKVAAGFDPAWSPTGTEIAYRANFAKSRTDIVVMNADGSGQRTLAKAFSVVPFLWLGGAPSWSPDVSMIVFAAKEGLYVVDAGGGEPRLLAAPADCVEYDPAWSPDGTQIAFGVGCSEEAPEAQADLAGLAVINADGTGWHRIIGPAPLSHGFPPSNPVWSPDGLHIAFDSVAGEGSVGNIYIANADGSDMFEFIEGIEPAWSPDGSKIAFCLQDNQDDQAEIFEVNIDGTGRTRITSTVAFESNPAWQPTFGNQ